MNFWAGVVVGDEPGWNIIKQAFTLVDACFIIYCCAEYSAAKDLMANGSYLFVYVCDNFWQHVLLLVLVAVQ